MLLLSPRAGHCQAQSDLPRLIGRAAPILNRQLAAPNKLGGLIPKIEEATMVPIRTRGSFDNPKTEPDVEEFGKHFLDTIRPDKLIKDIFK